MNNSTISQIINVAAKSGFYVTRADVKRVLEAQYAQSLWQEPCDCGDQIRHNNGGNYHQTLEMSITNTVIVVYESDTSETFTGDGEIFVTARTESGEWDEYEAHYEQEYDNAPADYTLRLNARRDRVIGVIAL